MVDFRVVPERTALVNVDLQNSFVENAPEGMTIVGRMNQLAAQCRTAGILVIHTSHVLRPDGSNIGVLSDGTASTGGDVEETTRYHRAALEIIGAMFGQVLTIEEALQKIAETTPPKDTASPI